ncbi:MAG TPA: hypothetical protein VLK84_05340 [Longimicrobium sp.]|nr:hypothetical protein [Longimicrobium sp.]
MIKKLKLDVDALAVESFPTSEGAGELRGTVRGHVSYLIPECPDMQTVLPLGACSTRCTATTRDTVLDCTFSCN